AAAARCPVSRGPLFFFSSRRRHTSFSRDWSSDVCSSDLLLQQAEGRLLAVGDQVRLEPPLAQRGGGHPAHGGDLEPGEGPGVQRSEEHTSELQSRENLVCRLLLEKKKKA